MASFSYRNVTENASPRAFSFSTIAAAAKRMEKAKAENPAIDFELIEWAVAKVSRRLFDENQRPYKVGVKELTTWKAVK